MESVQMASGQKVSELRARTGSARMVWVPRELTLMGSELTSWAQMESVQMTSGQTELAQMV
jgi:hypothetical protein